MKRIQSEATPKKIQKAVINLILEKSYDEITIAEITKCSGINRTTFYLFYSSKEELVRDMCFDFLDWYIESVSQAYLADEEMSKRIIMSDFEKMRKDTKLLKAIFSIRTNGLDPYLDLQNAIENKIRKKIPHTVDVEKANLAAKYYAANAAITVDWWTKNCDNYSTEYIYKIINTSVREGFVKLLS